MKSLTYMYRIFYKNKHILISRNPLKRKIKISSISPSTRISGVNLPLFCFVRRMENDRKQRTSHKPLLFTISTMQRKIYDTV